MNVREETACNDAVSDRDERREARRLYGPPLLIVHGTLQRITGNVGHGFLDFPEGSSLAG